MCCTYQEEVCLPDVKSGALQAARGRKREHSPGWSPMGLHVVKRHRALRTRPNRNTSALARFGKPLPPPRMDDYYEGSDLDLSSESEGPVYKPQSRADRCARPRTR